ncbi:hypothetical protein BC739_006503 [Kutzneria viridogrisea]|uniref:Uncharacterized protein n=1 Tax=Kutzneria viridogrisea TaxID=47990 RepID=A0ABR6BQX5_9PSEU|nr:hypothetical protein [Kutzneria albida]MBA8929285.1 hypothetical protein [Kutzneria viridogrisea]
MEQRANVEGGRVRRVLSRALLTIGGAVGITAAAWAFSAATASAGTVHQDDLLALPDVNTATSHSPETASADDGVHEMARAVATAAKPAVKSTDEALHGQHQALAAPGQLPDAADVERFTNQLKQDFDRVGQHLVTGEAGELVGDSVDLVQHVVQLPLAKLPVKVKLPIPVISGDQVVPAPTTGQQAVPAVTGAPVQRVLPQAVLGATTGGFSAAHKQHGPHTLPARSSDQPGPRNSAPVPSDPSSVPSAPCCAGHGGAGSPGSPTSTDRLSFGNTLGAAAIRAIKAISQSVSVMPGKQPGITPD